MRSLAGIRARIDELMEAQGEENGPPSCVVLLPENHRGPNYDGPWPYARRMGAVATIIYRLEDGQPTPEVIRQLIDGTVRS
jgi:hypothetical protein